MIKMVLKPAEFKASVAFNPLKIAVVLVLLHGRPKTMHNRFIATFDTL